MAIPSGATPLLDLDLLRTVVEIAETGNFSAAAAKVHRTPSAVSMQVKKLEDMVSRPLFVRDSRSVSLTGDGEVLLAHARRVLALNRDIVSTLTTPTLAGTVRLGAPEDFVERALPTLMRRFSETHCCITVDVVVERSEILEQKVHEGALDLAMITRDTTTALPRGFEVVFSEPLVWAGARNGVAWEQDPLPVSVWDENCSWRALGLKSLDLADRAYRVAFESAFNAGQRAVVKADLAIAPMPVSSCTDGIVALGPEHGLPRLPDYEIAIAVRDAPPDHVLAAAQYLKLDLGDQLAA